eukprot:TRINITY_DN5010_c0_g2_i1.p1 TRINITY_DN5010_c0_g2~~TRINITY_DN5010_c0_g2_i1.p1  ORF type:complete len:720 (+),score=64.12 TRINITY_DN5010_c0_g2_i1:176-2335(+)
MNLLPKRFSTRVAVLLALCLYLAVSLHIFLGSKPDKSASKLSDYIQSVRNSTRVANIFVSSAKIDRHAPTASLQLIASQLLALAVRTRRRVVLPPLLDGNIIRPNQYHDIPNDAVRLLPDLYEISEDAKQTGIENSIGQPSLWLNSKSKLFIIHFLCAGSICGNENAAYDCGSKLDLHLQLVAVGGPIVAKTKCVAFSDFQSRFVEDIITKEGAGMDVMLDNFHPNLMEPSSLIVRDEEDTRVVGHIRISQLLQLGSSKRLEAEKTARDLFEKDFFVVYYHIGWPLSAADEKLAVSSFAAWLQENANSLPRDALVIIHQRDLMKHKNITPDVPDHLQAALRALVERRFRVQQAWESENLSNDNLRILEHAVLTSSSCKMIVALSNHTEPFLSNILQLRAETLSTVDFVSLNRNVAAPSLSAPLKVSSFPIAFFVITINRLHNETVQRIVSSWAKVYEEHIFFISDTTSDAIEGSNLRIPNVIDSGCAHNLVEGLWCKNDFIFKYIQRNPKRFSGYKWFSRVAADALFLVDNLLVYLQHQDHKQKLLIGEKYCHQIGFPFAAGGPGFVFSRAFVEQFDWDLWTQIPLAHLPFYTDDIVTGYYCSKTPGCTLVHHPGFSNAAAGPPRNAVYPWYLSKSGNWNLPYRPIAFHQRGNSSRQMQQRLDELGRLNYELKQGDTLMVPDCKCYERVFGRCAISREMTEISDCKFDAISPYCIVEQG